jgi:hypothetical protein
MAGNVTDYRTAREYYEDKARERKRGTWAPDQAPLVLIARRRVVVDLLAPPVPDGRWDWRATWADYEPGDPQGFGATYEAALNDFRNQVEEN